jgi:exonuclease SbcD
MAFRFVHAADIHLDSPLLSLDDYPGAPLEEIRLATRKALGKLVDFSIESEAAFVVIAGDLFDGEWRDCNTGLYFISEMKRLRDAGIMAYIALGNHDAANRMTAGLPWPDHIRFFDHKRAERIPVPGCDAALYSQSFRRQHVDEDLTSSWPVGDTGTFNIGVLHTSAPTVPPDMNCTRLARSTACGRATTSTGHLDIFTPERNSRASRGWSFRGTYRDAACANAVRAVATWWTWTTVAACRSTSNLSM